MGNRMRRLAPLAGVVYVGLVVAVLFSPSAPDANQGGAKVIQWYADHHGVARGKEVMLAYAALAAVVYFASLAAYLRRRGADVLATTTIAGGVLASVGLMLGA